MLEINLLYDYLTPNGYLPNGLNPHFIQTLVENDFRFDHSTLSEYEKQFGAISVWHGEQVIEPIIKDSFTTSDMMDGFDNNPSHRPNPDSFYLYTVTPFGGASATYGYDFTYNEKKSFFHFISLNARSLIREVPNVYLFINYSNEGTIDFNWWKVIHDDANKFNIPLNKIIFCSSDYFTNMNYEIFKKLENIPDNDNIKLLYLAWSLHAKAKEMLDIHNGQKTTFNSYSNKCSVTSESDIKLDTIRDKKFLMFNRRLRPHRAYSICLFNNKNILDQFLISYDLNIMELFPMDDENIKMHIEHDDELIKLLQSEYEKLKIDNPKQTIDYDDLVNVWGFNFENKEAYLNSYIHITSETNFFEIGGYLSEKTWKPIGHLQPFIFMGPAFALVELRKLGFKTFSPFINESYDGELDPELRFKMIMAEIERLSKLDITEIHNWYNSIFKDILLHNQNLLFNNSDNAKTSEFVKNQFKKLLYDNTTL
jgi:hypothetical protein